MCLKIIGTQLIWHEFCFTIIFTSFKQCRNYKTNNMSEIIKLLQCRNGIQSDRYLSIIFYLYLKILFIKLRWKVRNNIWLPKTSSFFNVIGFIWCFLNSKHKIVKICWVHPPKDQLPNPRGHQSKWRDIPWALWISHNAECIKSWNCIVWEVDIGITFSISTTAATKSKLMSPPLWKIQPIK